MIQSICFEGADNTGKSTQIQRVADRLLDLGYAVKIFQEPSAPYRALFLQDDLSVETRLLIMAANRRANVEAIATFLATNANAIVLLDRFIDSTWAYQFWGDNRNDLEEMIESLQRYSTHGFTPDLTVYFEGQLSNPSADDIYERKGKDFFDRVASGFYSRKWTRILSGHSVLTIDCQEPIDQITDAIIKEIIPLH